MPRPLAATASRLLRYHGNGGEYTDQGERTLRPDVSSTEPSLLATAVRGSPSAGYGSSRVASDSACAGLVGPRSCLSRPPFSRFRTVRVPSAPTPTSSKTETSAAPRSAANDDQRPTRESTFACRQGPAFGCR
jgi:hypothetical protein